MLLGNEKLEFRVESLMRSKCLVLAMLKRGSDGVNVGLMILQRAHAAAVVEVVVVVGQTIGSISSRTLAYDCLCTLELCTA